MGTWALLFIQHPFGFKWFAFVYPTPVCVVAVDDFLSDGMFFGKTGLFFSI